MMHPNGPGGCGMEDPVGAGSVAFYGTPYDQIFNI